MIKVLVYVQQVHDEKRGIDFPKDKASYKGHTLDVTYSKDAKATLQEVIKARGLHFPLELSLEDGVDYFCKKVTFTRNDGTTGSKIKLVIMSFGEVSQGKFLDRNLDDLMAEMYPEEESDDTDF